ncbi:EAL domain-containing protein [Aquincola sp. MAHUQ-54]|uniref:EAL domain-containing protein n=1 Tax=Aquincola agrisoli TaxID=3119538 RepID=A0AAW9QJK8_9BURK
MQYESVVGGGVYTLSSAFQPIFSLAHRRLVGHEALLRATDAGGAAVAPRELFRRCRSAAESRVIDEDARRLHVATFAARPRPAEWLFVNVDASAFVAGDGEAAGDALLDAVTSAGVPPQQVVLELLEDAIPDRVDVLRAVRRLKARGFLIALDDFGAGHSNLDRVFALEPTFVKLDRSVVKRAARSETVRRVTTQVVSLLHECGALVVMEGIERADEAAIALDSDADFVQGYHFARPGPLAPPGQAWPVIDAVWALCEERWSGQRADYDDRLRPYVEAIGAAGAALAAGAPAEAACAAFLALAEADVCYLLHSDGRQCGANLSWRPRAVGDAQADPFAPLRDSSQARWSRRPYFRRAAESPGQVQVTRPYMTVQSLRMCVTLSVSYERGGERMIVCGDVEWMPAAVRPDFVATTGYASL